MRGLGGPTGPRQASLNPQPRLPHRALFLVEEGGALERPPVKDAAKGLACASHYLGLRGAFATLARQGWAAVAEWLSRHWKYPLYIGHIAGFFAVWGPYASQPRLTRRPASYLKGPMLASTANWWRLISLNASLPSVGTAMCMARLRRSLAMILKQGYHIRLQHA